MDKGIYLAALLTLMVAPTSIVFAEKSPNIDSPFKTLWGKPSPSQVIFLPAGIHYGHTNNVNNEQWLVAVNYHSFIGGTFINSANHRVFFGGIERQIYKGEKLAIDYLLAIMQGYKGAGLNHLWPILRHDPGPLAAVTASWSLTDHLAINMASYGVGGLVGIIIIFNRDIIVSSSHL